MRRFRYAPVSVFEWDVKGGPGLIPAKSYSASMPRGISAFPTVDAQAFFNALLPHVLPCCHPSHPTQLLENLSALGRCLAARRCVLLRWGNTNKC